jgi:cyclopropane fatty-acyl-phospholipid synthase-like methyltransferase
MFNKLFKLLLLTLLTFLPFSITSKEVNNSINTELIPSFGYWEHLSLNKLSNKERIISENSLYRYVLDHLELDNDDKILEAGVLKGLGAKIISNEYTAKNYIGVDFSDSRITLAKEINRDLLNKNETYKFLTINSQKLPFENQSFSRIFSINNVLDFYSFKNFVYEAERLLRQNGKIVIAAPFAKNHKSQAILENYNQVEKIKLPHIDDVRLYFKNKGFVDLHIEPIGQYIFNGYNTWINKIAKKNPTDNIWKTAYDENLVDYYVISGYKPVELIRM